MMIGKRSYFNIFLMMASVSLITSCSEDDTVRQLSSNDSKATFTLPAKYKTSNAHKELISFAFHYPNMTPITPGNGPVKDEIKIYLRATSATDRFSANYTNHLEDNAINQFDPSRRGQEYRIKDRGIYRMYQQGNPTDFESLSTYYVFNATDGQRVTVKDPLPFIVNFKAHRAIGYRFELQYTIAKPIGTDFTKIDEAVMALINGNTTIKTSSKE